MQPTTFRYELHFFMTNVQVATNILYVLHFSRYMCNYQQVFHMGCNFLQKCATLMSFLYELHFPQEMCNHQQFSVRLALFSRNMQVETIFCFQVWYRCVCLGLTDFQYKLHFTQLATDF
jgi:hypothetical protein